MRFAYIAMLALTSCVPGDVDAASQELTAPSCTITVAAPAAGLVAVTWSWTCPLGGLAVGNSFVSRADGTAFEISGARYACGSTLVTFVALVGLPLVVSGDVASGGVGPVACSR